MTRARGGPAAVEIRVLGEPGDVEDALDAIREALHVTRVSRPFPCRGDTKRVRVYVDVDHRVVTP